MSAWLGDGGRRQSRRGGRGRGRGGRAEPLPGWGHGVHGGVPIPIPVPIAVPMPPAGRAGLGDADVCAAPQPNGESGARELEVIYALSSPRGCGQPSPAGVGGRPLPIAPPARATHSHTIPLQLGRHLFSPAAIAGLLFLLFFSAGQKRFFSARLRWALGGLVTHFS